MITTLLLLHSGIYIDPTLVPCWDPLKALKRPKKDTNIQEKQGCHFKLMTSLQNNNKDTSGSIKRNTWIGAEGMASTSTNTIINNQTIATNTSNLHITRTRVELDSSLQGHLKALSKLTRGIERANHHTELLQSSIDSRRPPRGLIPKVTPRIPDTPATFTIEWEHSLHRAGLILTEKLRDY